MKKHFAVALLMLLSAAFAAAQQQHPTVQRGFQPDRVYQLGSVDSVNVFNGNVLVTPPIGGRYPVSANLSYGLTLVYNAKIWEHSAYYNFNQYFTRTRIDPQSNAGAGWRLTLGVLGGDNTAAWSYESPDGSLHQLAGTKNPYDAPSLIEPNVWYTRDGSQIRVKKVGVLMQVEFPDGSIHEHEWNAATGRWRLWRMRDQSEIAGQPANWVTVSYAASSENCTGESSAWILQDVHSRRHDVCFKNETYDGTSQPTVSEVVLSGFQGAQERYTLGYTTASPFRARTGSNPWIWDSDFVPIPTLTSIALPDGSHYEMKYWSPYTGDGVAQAQIEELKYPTGGKVRWEYQRYGMVHSEGCSSAATDAYYFSDTKGVRHKKQFDENNNLIATWEYRPFMESTGQLYQCWTGDVPGQGDPIQGPPGEMPGEQFTVTVITPDKDKTIHYFTVWPGYNNATNPSPTTGTGVGEYGLPYTHAGSMNGRFLSTETFDCVDAAAGNCPSTPQRRTYVSYDRDLTIHHRDDDHKRVQGTLNVFVEDGNRWVDVDNSDFDGYGNYRTTTTTGFDGTPRTTYTNFNWLSDQYGRKADGSRAVGPFDPWFLGNHTDAQIKTGSTIFARTYSCFSLNGFLLGRRVLSNPASGVLAGNDLVTFYEHDANGNLSQEDWYGGDTQSVSGITSLCQYTAPAGSRYRRTYFYAGGSLQRSYAHSEGGSRPAFLQLAYNIIDDKTGLVWKSVDLSGVITTYSYGPMLRLASVSTPGSASTSYQYKNAGDPGYPLATVLVNVDSADAANDSQQKVRYDGLGRVKYESREMPDGVTATRETRHDGMGRRSHLSEWEITPSHYTEFFYDAYGRPAKIRTADGKETLTLWTSGGIRELKRTASIGTVYAGGSTVNETPVTVTDLYDMYGRLKEVHEHDVTTYYTYDLANRLTFVQMDGWDRQGTSTGQQRQFIYDTRGFLDKEIHPESGETDYQSYDARGHALLKFQGPTRDIFDLQFELDPAERLTKIWSRNPYAPTEFRLSKEFIYDSANNYGLSAGKLVQAIRHNHNPGLGDVVVTDTFTYGMSGANQGRVDNKFTRIDNATAGTSYQELTQQFSYNDLGQRTTHWYPQCVSQSVGCGAATTSSITRTYQKGFLKSVSGYVDNITYHPNGLTNQIVHSGTTQVVDTQAIDTATGMPRPKSISFGNATSCTSPTFTQPADRTIAPNTSTTLTTTVGGTGALTVKWYQEWSGARLNYVGSGTSYTTPALSATTRYWFEVINSCGVAESGTITVSMCGNPVLSGPAPQTIPAGTGTTLTATVTSGSGPFTYEWFRGMTLMRTFSTSATSDSYPTGNLDADTTFRVRVTTSCGSWAENTVLISVTCSAPTVTGPTPVTIQPNAQTTLSVSASGAAQPFTYAWFIGSTQVGSGSSYPTGVLTSTTTYKVRVTNTCGAYTEKTATVTVAPPPSGLAAASINPTRIDLAWTPTNSVQYYEVERKSGGGGYVRIQTPAASSWPDQTVTAGNAYAYRVRAVHTDGTLSAYTNVDFGTTFTFAQTLQPFVTVVDDSHVTELRNAVNALRITAGIGAFTFTDNPLQPGVTPVRAIHLTQLRTALNEARSALNVPQLSFTDPTITAAQTNVRAAHWNELREGCK